MSCKSVVAGVILVHLIAAQCALAQEGPGPAAPSGEGTPIEKRAPEARTGEATPEARTGEATPEESAGEATPEKGTEAGTPEAAADPGTAGAGGVPAAGAPETAQGRATARAGESAAEPDPGQAEHGESGAELRAGGEAAPPATAAVDSGLEAAARVRHRGRRWYEGHPQRDPILDLEVPIRLSGYFWVDSGTMQRSNAQEGQYDQNAAYMQGRFVLAAEYLREIQGLYARARTELIGFVNEFTKSQFEAHVLDAFVEIGQHGWDVQIGRFLAWEVYHRGQGIELFTPEEAGALGGPALYWLDVTRGYRNESGQAAVHLYPFEALGIEIAGVYGQEANQNNFGLRPVADFRLAGLQLIAGYEFLKQLPQTEADQVEVTSHGVAAKLQYTLAPATLGVNAAWRDVEYIDIQGLIDGEKTFDNTSLGAFLDLDFWYNSVGFGYHYTTQENHQGEDNQHHRAFVSYRIFLPIDGLSVKAVYGYAVAIVQDVDTSTEWDNSMHSLRLRVAYDFK